MTAMATGINRLTQEEEEELHLRIATARSLNDPNINPEQIVRDILSRHDEIVPIYPGPQGSRDENDESIRQQIAKNDGRLWNSVFSIIQRGQIDALDHFIELGLDVNTPHPLRKQYPIFIAVQASQTNMMRHLINHKVDVNVFSAQGDGFFIYPDMEQSRTPLMIAAEQGNLNICKILCETAFADPMLVAPDGLTAQRLAARKGHKEIVDYLPANRQGALKRLQYDYRHRWTFIRRAVDGIYTFFRFFLWETPKFLLYHLPKWIIEETGKGLLRVYRVIPPLKEWPGIFKRAIVSIAKGMKRFVIDVGKVIKATPKAIFDFVKWTGKSLWSGIKAIPGLVKRAAEKTWAGLKAAGIWIGELFMSILSFLHTIVSAIIDFFRSITLKDILNGLYTVFHAIFVSLPKLLWSGIEALARGIQATLIAFFDWVYWLVYYIIYAIVWIVTFVPKRIGEILLSIAGGIGKAFKELWLWISPKSMG